MRWFKRKQKQVGPSKAQPNAEHAKVVTEVLRGIPGGQVRTAIDELVKAAKHFERAINKAEKVRDSVVGGQSPTYSYMKIYGPSCEALEIDLKYVRLDEFLDAYILNLLTQQGYIDEAIKIKLQELVEG